MKKDIIEREIYDALMTMHILAFFRLFLSLRKSFLKVTQQSKRIKLVSFCCALLENPLICFTVFFYFFFSLAGMFKGNNQFPTPKSKSFLVFCCIFSILMLVSCFFFRILSTYLCKRDETFMVPAKMCEMYMYRIL